MGRITSAADILSGKPLKALADAPGTWRGLSCASLAERYALYRSLGVEETTASGARAGAAGETGPFAPAKPEGSAG